MKGSLDPPGPVFRPARDDDATGVIALIARVFTEYPNCVLDVDAEEPELLAPASRFDGFWVVEVAGEVLGCIGCGEPASGPTADAALELKKLYLDPRLRGRGWGRRLVEWIEAEARRRGYSRVILWTDTRFETAHRVYQRLGYRRTGRTRALHDLSDTVEYHFLKDLPPA